MLQRVVLVAVTDELRDRLLEALGPFSTEAVEVPSVQRGLELTREIPIHLMVIRYPMDGMSLKAFVTEFRESGCASRGAQVVVLAPGRSIGGLKRSAGEGVAILRSDSGLEDLADTFMSFLRRAPRFAGNLMVGADLITPTGQVRKMLQIANISESGMLVRTKTRMAIGDTFSFELQIPELKSPIRGQAEVVRLSEDADLGGKAGIGVKIVTFVGDSQERLKKFLKMRRLPPAMAK